MAPICVLVAFSLAILSSSCASLSVDRETYSPSERQKERYEEGDNPYVFDRQSLIRTRTSSRAGEIRILPNFRQKSELLRGLEKYVMAYIEMKPNSLMKPLCFDADWVLVVGEGSGYIAYVQENNNLVQRRLEEGDVFVVPSGQIFYLINSNDQQTFRLVNLLYTVSTPGRFEPFYMAGGRNPESVFSALSPEVLEAAFDTREGVERMVSGEEEEAGEERQAQGAIIHLSKQELETITRGQSTRETIPAAHEQSPFNIFNHRPKFQNNYGKVIEADAREHAELGLLNLAVGVVVLHSGSMMVPNYNTRAIKIGIVLSGEGTMEMACPHLAGRGEYEEIEQRQGVSYQKVRARLTAGTGFVVPTAHPYTEIASSGRSLRILCFEINAQGNRRHFLAGRNSALKALDSRVVGRSFGISPEDMSRILDKQKDEVIVRGSTTMDGAGIMSWT